MDMQQLFEIIEPLFDFWLLVALCATMVSVQVFKVALKHYANDRWDPFFIKAAVFIFAVIAGYTLTRLFLELPNIEERRLAMAVALLNVAAYEVTLAYVQRKGWVYMEGVLRMKPASKGEHDDS